MISQNRTREQASEWLRSVVSKYTPSNARRYTQRICLALPQLNALGLMGDSTPAEGVLVEVSDGWALIKTGRADFMVVDQGIMESIPGVGSKVRVTPYSRRRFDGKSMRDPFISVDKDGNSKTCQIIGGHVLLPLDKANPDAVYLDHTKGDIRGEFLLDMITQVESMVTPDGMRTIAGCLVDAGCRVEGFSYCDPADDNDLTTYPFLQFAIDNTRHTGFLQIAYDVGMDTYWVKLLNDRSEPVQVIDDVHCLELAEKVYGMIDDGVWRVAKVAVLKKAPTGKVA